MYYVEKVFANPPRQFLFDFTTQELYPDEYTLQYRVQRNSDRIGIRFTGLQKEGDCPDFPSPHPQPQEGCTAEATVSLNDLTEGTYDFVVETPQYKAGGKLEITTAYATVELDEANISVAPDTVLRIPPNSIFGSVLFDTPPDSSVALSFFDALEELGARHVDLRDGVYHQLGTIEDNRLVCITRGCEKYIYKYTGAIENVLDVARRFQRESNVEITVATSEGREYPVR